MAAVAGYCWPSESVAWFRMPSRLWEAFAAIRQSKCSFYNCIYDVEHCGSSYMRRLKAGNQTISMQSDKCNAIYFKCQLILCLPFLYRCNSYFVSKCRLLIWFIINIKKYSSMRNFELLCMKESELVVSTVRSIS